ncbi:hypothetical protein L798_07257 [Zootermopsis nevadensis]|uniref:Uncharacterized protein n=1 Tax=Zootermopsis nevadensis TaxID=136037 RepID=A0A067R3J1_ZOONE|nr:hypothetical protein L798_07257 [Zootermopsis nevadensis]
MMCDELVSNLHNTEDSLLTTVPEIIMQGDEIFPSLKETLNVDIIKREGDMDVLGEEDSTGMITDEFYVPSFCTIKTEPKDVDINSVENYVDALSEEHSTGLQTHKVYIPSPFSIIKAEPRVSSFFPGNFL